ncbi:MAG: alpha/beta hydrolase [Bosea sp. (in: a-proteobacteria)]
MSEAVGAVPPVWQSFTRTALDAAYNNMAAVADSAARLADWERRSAALRARMPGEIDIPYGPRQRNRIDLFRCGNPQAPLLVFIHGGWWQRNSRQVFSCMAEGPLAVTMDVALVGYTLAPDASLTQISAEIVAALDALAAREEASTCVLAGWSAGGHLTALALTHPFVAAGLSISGVFDLEPIRHSYINDKLRLDADEARLLSPARLPPVRKPLVLAYGLSELPELQRQSYDHAAHMSLLVPEVVALPLQRHDHFSILEELAQPGGLLCRQALALVQQRA